MDKKKIVSQTVSFVKQSLTDKGSSHDWWHIYRVWNMAKRLARAEGADMFIVEVASLLHDIADRKLNKGDEQVGLQKVREFLTSYIQDEVIIKSIISIIENYSYTAHLKNKKNILSLEGKIVQDADRLDAIGAIGIARAFSYGGQVGRPLYDPSIAPRKNVSAKKYTAAPSPSINHFYEKLLLLKDLMNTKSAKKIAKKRHEFMERYLEQFYKEWNGEDY
jgi:uncharacterized protein